MESPPIVCTLTSEELRHRRAGLLREVRGRTLASRRWVETPPAAAQAGFELRLPRDEASLALLFELVRLESQCCAFLRFRVTVEAAGPLSLEVTGPPGGAELLASELVT